MPAKISSTALAGARYRSPSRYSGAGRARVSSLPLTVNGNASITTTAAGHHIGRQPLGQRGAHLGRVGGPGDIAHQALITGAVLAGDHHRLLHPVQPGQRRLHLTQLDAIPADLDLLIGAPQIPQLPISTPTHQIPGAIHPRPRPPERTRHKPRPGQPGPAHITHPHPATGHIQLPHHPRRHRPQPAIQHKQRRPRHRRTDRRPPTPPSAAHSSTHTPWPRSGRRR